uniref:Phosphate-binding protein n=1 Tax=Cyanothece sp. (strain PCC 7425 / ATCC 29141) TaxID=395961 RepID=B8HV05_CYAP4
MLGKSHFNRRALLLGLSGVFAAFAVAPIRLQSATADQSSPQLAQSRVTLTGAGASFPAPLYQRWFSEYSKLNPNVQVSYQSVGSGAGVNQFTAGTVDFGASDVAMTDAEIAKVSKGVVLLPMTAGSVVVVFNVPGVTSLRLSRTALAGIFLGQIKTWNNPAIAATNKGAKLPNLPIRIVHRSDGSGTTALFTRYLSAISPQWKNGPGEGRSVQWPTGTGAKGNEGVSALLEQTKGGIAYVEYFYAKSNKIPAAALQNRSGNFIQANAQTSSATLAGIKLPENLRGFDADPTGPNEYPIVSFTWIMAYRNMGNPTKARALRQVLTWSAREGQAFADDLGYIPLPPSVQQRVIKAINLIQ